MAIWNSKKTKGTTTLKESSTGFNTQKDISQLFSQHYYPLVSNVTSLKGTNKLESTIKQAMLNDPIITQVINMWISDTLAKDVLSNKTFEVEIKDNGSGTTSKKLSDLKGNIDYLLENSNLDEQLVSILYNIITRGITSVRLGFVDKYEDTKIKLFESNKKKYLKESDNIQESVKKLLEAPTYDDYDNETESYAIRVKQKQQRLIGRYYFEILPQKIVPLQHKGITILYVDLDNATKVLNPKNITTFVNTRGGTKTLSVKENYDDIESTLYEVPLGKSFIDHAVTPWSLFNTVQDCTILALMTRSSIYRLFLIDVDSLGAVETENLLQDFKKRITTRETFDVRSQHYSSSQTQIPLGDSLVIPVRNGIGNVSVESIGGDLNIHTEEQLKFFRQELLASLGIAEQLIYGDQTGGLINTSATKSDIRYLRTIQQYSGILSLGLEDIFKDYLTMLGEDLSKITLKVVFSQLNSEESSQKMQYEQLRQESLDRTLTSLNNLGISFESGNYTGLRNELITRYMDQSLLDIIKNDEGFGDPVMTSDQSDLEDLPSSSGVDDFADDVLPEVPSDEEDSLDDVDDGSLEQSQVEPVDTVGGQEPPYSIG